MITTPSLRPSLLSAFTGAGGLDLGLERAGFRTIACIEQDQYARATIQANRPGWNLLKTGDILEVAGALSPKDLGLRPKWLGVLAGGPPCQPFSTAAQWAERGRQGTNDPRSITLLAFLELAARFLPRVILIENVIGFVQGGTSGLDILDEELQRINRMFGTAYRAEYKVIQAADFGVPQRRRRAIIVARRDGKSFAWPTPTHANIRVRAYDALWDIRPNVLPKATGQWADLLPSIPAGMNYQHFTSRGKGTRLFGHRSWFWSFLLKLAPDQPAWTIPAQAGPATGPFHWDNRPLAPKELARLQSFPKAWAFVGTCGAQKRQIGNATPPLLAEVVGRAIASSVFGLEECGKPTLSISRKRSIPIPPAVRPVPARYLERQSAQPDHPGVGAGPGALRRRRADLLRDLGGLLGVLRAERTSHAESSRIALLNAFSHGKNSNVGIELPPNPNLSPAEVEKPRRFVAA
jgi:DNA (cytosine-5)-methyltransferase 1